MVFHSMLWDDYRDQSAESNRLLLPILYPSGKNSKRARSDSQTGPEAPRQAPRKRTGLSMSMQGLEGRPKEENGLRFDKSVSLGHVLTMAVMISGILTAYVTYKVTISDHASRIERLEKLMEMDVQSSNNQTRAIYDIQREVAIIKDRLERSSRKNELPSRQ